MAKKLSLKPLGDRLVVKPAEKEGEKKNKPPPVLVIYAFINRHYMLDLLPEVSVLRSLLYQRLDMFAKDWETPSAYDRTLTIGHFVRQICRYYKKDYKI